MHKTKKIRPFHKAGAKWKNRIYEKSKNRPADFPHWICVLKWVKSFTPEWDSSKSTASQNTTNTVRIPFAESIKLVHKFLKCVLHSLVVSTTRGRWCGCRKHFTVWSSGPVELSRERSKVFWVFMCLRSLTNTEDKLCQSLVKYWSKMAFSCMNIRILIFWGGRREVQVAFLCRAIFLPRK